MTWQRSEITQGLTQRFMDKQARHKRNSKFFALNKKITGTKILSN